MSRRNRRGLGGGGHEEDEILNAIENGQVEGTEEETIPTSDEDIAGDTPEEITPEAEGDKDEEGDFDVLDALNGKVDETPSTIKDRIEKEERPPRPPRNETAVETEKDITFADTERFGAGITLDIKNNNNKNNGGNRMSRVTKLSAIIAGKMPQVQNGRSLANFRGLNFILEPQDILKFIGESIAEYNPEAKLAMDRIKASTIVSTILQAAENIDEGKEDRKYVMNRLAMEMTGLGFEALKDLRDSHVDVIVLQLPRKGYTTQGDPDNIIGGGLKKDYVKAGTIIEEFGILTPTKQVPAMLFTGDDNLRLDGGIQVYTDLYKMSLICTIMLYNVFSMEDALGSKGGKVGIEVGAKGYGTYEVMTYLNKGNVPFVK